MGRVMGHRSSAEVRDAYALLKRGVRADLDRLCLEQCVQLRPSLVYLPDHWRPVMLQQPITLFKVVATAGGRLVSVFDGSVDYVLKKRALARHGGACNSLLWPPLWSCMHCFETEDQALAARFPTSSRHLRSGHVLIRVTAQGHAYASSGGRWAVSDLLVEEVLHHTPAKTGGSDASLLHE